MSSINTSDGQEIFYDADRVGKNCIVLLHGLGGNLTAWEPTRKILRQSDYKTLAIDLRGQGKSGRPEGLSKYSFERLAKDVHEVLLNEKIGKCILVGHCYGGVVAIYFANLFPSLIEKLILINTTYKKPFNNRFFSNKFTKQILNFAAKILPVARNTKNVDFTDYKGTSDYDVKRICSDILHTSSKSYVYLLTWILNLNARIKLNTIKCPTLVVSGSKDTVYPTKISRQISESIKEAKLEVVEGENHIIVINNPEITAQKILEFVKND